MRSRRVLMFPAICLLSLGLMAGCHNNYEMPAPRPIPSLPNPHLHLSLQTTPRLLRQMDPVTFTVRVTGDRGRPLPQARVGAELTMPTMEMGKNAVALTPTTPGVYSGTGRFSMDGDWAVVVSATTGREQAVQSFPVHVH